MPPGDPWSTPPISRSIRCSAHRLRSTRPPAAPRRALRRGRRGRPPGPQVALWRTVRGRRCGRACGPCCGECRFWGGRCVFCHTDLDASGGVFDVEVWGGIEGWGQHFGTTMWSSRSFGCFAGEALLHIMSWHPCHQQLVPRERILEELRFWHAVMWVLFGSCSHLRFLKVITL